MRFVKLKSLDILNGGVVDAACERENTDHRSDKQDSVKTSRNDDGNFDLKLHAH